MTGPLRALLRKELTQHGLALWALALLLALAFVIEWWQLALRDRVLSQLELASTFALVPLSLAALYLGHRLVVQEYYASTQRFIETLPAGRGQMELVKYLLGFGFLIAAAAAALAASIELVGDEEPISTRFVLIMSARLGAYVFVLWSALFCMGFLGRLRIPLYALGTLAILLLNQYTDFEFGRFGPLAALDSVTFAFEREQFPIRALSECALIGAAFLALALALARLREGGVVEQLARPMTQRERVMALTIVLCAVMAGFSIGNTAVQTPYRFTTEQVARSKSGSVAVAYFYESARESGTRVMKHLEQRVDPLWRALGPGEVAPTVRIALAPGEIPGLFSTTHSHPTEGIVVEANFTDASPRLLRELDAYVLHEMISAHTSARALIEPKHWVLDGFSRYFADHPVAREPVDAPTPEVGVVRALVASEDVPVSRTSIRDWDTTSERLGYPMADSFAYLGLRQLEEQGGREDRTGEVEHRLARRPYPGIIETIWERRNSMDRLFHSSTGLEWNAFVRQWASRAAQLRVEPAYASALRAVPRGFARIEPMRNGARSELHFDVQLSPVPSETDACSFAQRYVGPTDAPVDVRDTKRIERLWPRGTESLKQVVAARFGADNRIIAAVDCELAALGVPLRVGIRRLLMP